MAIPRPLPVVLSFLFAIGLWVYGVVRLQTEGGIRGAYATLVCADTYSDREIRDRLDGQGLRDLVSESDQWFLLDCFGTIEKIPLVMYEERLLPFDPRNDGYAEKLQSLFVRDGKRFVYIPLEKNRPENMETEVARALSDVSYSLEYARYPPRRDFIFPLISICLTICAFFVIPALRRWLNAGLLPCLIALSPLALGLAPGFALVSLLAGFAALLAEPGQPHTGRQRPYDLPRPFTARWLLAVALIACYGFFSFFSGLPVLFAFLVLASFCCLLLVSVRSGGGGKFPINVSFKKRYQHRHRFTPVEIISRKTVSSGFFPVMLPFAAMALALAFTNFARPQPLPSPVVNVSPLPPGAVTEADFQEHYLFQSAFSFRALGETYEDGRPAITGYGLSSSGLLDPVAPGVDEELQIPDFPLSDLLRGLSSDLPRVADEVNPGNSTDRLFASLPMLFILPAFIHSIKRKRQGGFRLLNNR